MMFFVIYAIILYRKLELGDFMDYEILLYYYFTHIEDPESVRDEHLQFVDTLGVKGRIIISKEGINGTISGTKAQTKVYQRYIKETLGYHDIHFKIDEADGHVFPRMSVKVKNELCRLSLDHDLHPNDITGTYLEPKDYYEKLKDPNTVILDARNDYEYDLGHFKNAIKPDIKHFRDLPEWFQKNKEKFEGKTVLTYCTGGVRCEKFSGYMKREGIEDVYQLKGGIVTYGKDPEVQGKLWEGKCYVFDGRIGVPVNRVDPVIVGKDYFTGEPCERYINCANPRCNKKMICSEESEKKYHGSCCEACRNHEMNRYETRTASRVYDE